MKTTTETKPGAVPDLAERLVQRIARIHARGWCEATSGNFSVVAGHEPLRLLVTRSGFDKATVSTSDLMTIDADAKPADDLDGTPSAEVLLHVTLARRARAEAVLHSHSVWGTLLGEHFVRAGGFSITGYEMLKAFECASTHRAHVFVPVVENTQDMPALARSVEGLLEEHPAAPGFLIAGHGLYTWGPGLAEAARHLEGLEFLFEVVGRRTRFESFKGRAGAELG